jgi:cysteine-rich repeat protein
MICSDLREFAGVQKTLAHFHCVLCSVCTEPKYMLTCHLCIGAGCSENCEVEEGWTCESVAPEEDCGYEASVCLTTCGDDITAGDEECDALGSDGCTDSCTARCGWRCDGDACTPSSCGDGVTVGEEECDDANTDRGDGNSLQPTSLKLNYESDAFHANE